MIKTTLQISSLECIRSYSEVPISVVEDHHDVVPVFHRAIASKYLPFSDICLIHFDSHPDLLIPHTMPADIVYSKHELYHSQSIENWILPQVYAGHISNIFWFKPPWASQIKEQQITFYVGKCLKTGSIRTTCKENYFISECLLARESELINKREVTLTVISVEPEDWISDEKRKKCKNNVIKQTWTAEIGKGSHPNMNFSGHCEIHPHNISNSIERQCHGDKTNDTQNEGVGSIHSTGSCLSQNCSLSSQNAENKDRVFSLASGGTTGDDAESLDGKLNRDIKAWRWSTMVQMVEKLRGKPYILDIDLDFFSTKNPFKDIYTNHQLKLMKELYKFQAPEDTSEQGVVEYVERRQKHLNELKSIFVAMNQIPPQSWQHNCEEDHHLLETLVADIKDTQGAIVDWELVHEAGCTMDDTELPHHVSTEAQIFQLMQEVKEILQRLPRPTIITLARSSNDDYCPKIQVDLIEDAVLSTLDEIYLYTKVHRLYEEEDGS